MCGINDVFGHQTGDRILIGVADTFIRLLGSDGRLVRLGGDEFLIAYCGDDLDALIDLAVTELQRAAVTSELVGGRTVTLSAGIASAEPDQIADLETLYKRADSALYSAKKKGPRISGVETALARTGTWQL